MQCKAGQSFYTNNVEASEMRGSSVGFPSFPCNPRNTMRYLCFQGTGVGSKRGKQVVVASSPSTEDVVDATEPLTKEDLVAYLASGCKPKEKWRCVF